MDEHREPHMLQATLLCCFLSWAMIAAAALEVRISLQHHLIQVSQSKMVRWIELDQWVILPVLVLELGLRLVVISEELIIQVEHRQWKGQH